MIRTDPTSPKKIESSKAGSRFRFEFLRRDRHGGEGVHGSRPSQTTRRTRLPEFMRGAHEIKAGPPIIDFHIPTLYPDPKYERCCKGSRLDSLPPEKSCPRSLRQILPSFSFPQQVQGSRCRGCTMPIC